MQVERIDEESLLSSDVSGGRVSNTWATYPVDWDNSGKPELIPDRFFTLMRKEGKMVSAIAYRWARGALASW